MSCYVAVSLISLVYDQINRAQQHKIKVGQRYRVNYEDKDTNNYWCI